MTTGFPGLPGIDLKNKKKAEGMNGTSPSFQSPDNKISFQQLMDLHLEEIGRSQIAYQEYKDHGRLDLANGAHIWAEQQREALREMGVNPELYQGIDLTGKFRAKHPSDPVVAYDFTQQGRVPITDYQQFQERVKQAYAAINPAQQTVDASAVQQAEAIPENSNNILSSAPEKIQKYIQTAAEEVGVDPNLLAAIAKSESDFDENSTSPSGAIGLFQLMPITARSLGIDPFDSYQNVLGGAKYIKDKLDKYNGNVHLALAAYNAGPGRVDRAIRNAGSTDWDSLNPYLPSETRHFVPKVLHAYV